MKLPERLQPPAGQPPTGPLALSGFLNAWCLACPLPVVLLLDEVDALRDEALLRAHHFRRGLLVEDPTLARDTRQAFEERHYVVAPVLALLTPCGWRDRQKNAADSLGRF